MINADITAPVETDIAIIGAGSAGLSAQREVAKVTDNYRVIDPGPLGTLCARTACMPSKTFIHIANAYRHINDTPAKSARDESNPAISQASIDTAAVLKRVREYRDDFVSGIKNEMADWQENHLIRSAARFVDPHTLALDGATLKAGNIVVATGSIPVIPSNWQDYRDYLITSDDFFELEALPKRIAVLGLGAVGIELAQGLAHLGVEVYAFDPAMAIGGLTDPEIQAYARDYFQQSIILRAAAAELISPDSEGIGVKVEDEVFRVDKVLLAMGRKPNVRSLGLEKLNVELDDKGLPAQLNPQTLQVESLPIFMAGDVNGLRPVLHEAADEGRIAGFNAVNESVRSFNRWPRFSITFSSPNIAVVGKSHAELCAENIDFCTGSVNFEHQGRARLMGANAGCLNLYARPRDGLLLGAEMLAPGAEHLAHLMAWAIAWQKTVSEISEMPFYHPVLEEGLRTALRRAARQIETSPTQTQAMRCEDCPVI